MERIAEEMTLSERVLSELQVALPDMRIERFEKDGKEFVVCDYPVPTKGGVHSAKSPERALYDKFFAAFQNLMPNDPAYFKENVSSKGQTDLPDVRAIVDQKTLKMVYVLPFSSWEKLGDKPFEFHAEPIARSAKNWLVQHWKNMDKREFFAFSALSGESCQQLVAVAAGLKPLAIELPVGRRPELDKVIQNLPHLRTITRPETEIHAERKQKPLQPVFHLPAVEAVIADHHVVFERIGLGNDSPENIIHGLLDFYENMLEDDPSLTDDCHEAFGLLLGFDAKSCRDLRHRDVEKTRQFIPRDHAGWHPFNQIPFNFYDVDYWISDPENNHDFQNLRKGYQELVQRIQTLFAKGLSPLEVLAAVHESYQTLREDVANKVKATIATT